MNDTTVCEGASCPFSGDGGSGIDGSPAVCVDSSQCTDNALPICDTGSSMCRACTESAECLARDGAYPACSAGACVECVADDDCPSTVCDTEQLTCIAETNVIYTDPVAGSISESCGDKNTPCISINTALTHVTATRNIIKAADGIYSTESSTIAINEGVEVTLLAGDGVKLDLNLAEPVITVNDNASFTMIGGSIEDTPAAVDAVFCTADGAIVRLMGVTVTGAGDAGVHCIGTTVIEDSTIELNDGAGIDASSGANVRVVRSTLSANGDDGLIGALVTTVEQSTIAGNGSFGISTAGSFTLSRNTIRNNTTGGVFIDDGEGVIVNNIVYGNGSEAGGATGGIKVLDYNDHTVTIEFNTVFSNSSDGPFAAGLYCEPADGSTITSPNNLVYYNGASGNVNSGCAPAYSNIGDGNAAGTNFNDFPNVQGMESNNFSLTAQSPCRDAASPGHPLDIDFEGDPRPINGRSDCGADEFVP